MFKIRKRFTEKLDELLNSTQPPLGSMLFSVIFVYIHQPLSLLYRMKRQIHKHKNAFFAWSFWLGHCCLNVRMTLDILVFIYLDIIYTIFFSQWGLKTANIVLPSFSFYLHNGTLWLGRSSTITMRCSNSQPC